MQKRYAVMGNPIAHSLSPLIHQQFAQQSQINLSYEKIEIDLASFEQQVLQFFAQGGKGLNITLPCKQRAFAMANVVTNRCAQAQAANTLWMHAGKLHADNTDGVGLMRDLRRHLELADKRILLLGAGGAARGILAPLIAAKPAILTLANRSLDKAMALQKEFPQITTTCSYTSLDQPFDIIINATSASLTAQNLALPAMVTMEKPFCYDLAYSQKGMTPFVAWAHSQHCNAIDGLGMLVEQAAEAFFIWHQIMPETDCVLHHLRT
jgi:shikimate dehydrogenase